MASGNSSASGADIVIDSTIVYQTMRGWEATLQAGQAHSAYPLYRDTLFALAVDDLGIDRVRIDVRSGLENDHDWFADFAAGRIDMAEWRCHRYAPVNDDADPLHRNDAGFYFTELDDQVEKVLLPLRDAMRARGRSLFVNVTFVAFSAQACSATLLVHDDPTEYAEFVLAVVHHLDERYGIVPDSWEVILEPDNTTFWRGRQIGEAVVAAAQRLEANGYSGIEFVAPSNTNMARAVDYFDEMARVPGALAHVGELAYHRYGGVSRSALQSIAARVRGRGIGSAMLEHIGADYEELHDDLSIGNASAWQQYALAFPIDTDNGAQYFLIDVRDPAHPRVVPGRRTRYLRQYFRYVQRGARRVEATSRSAALHPLAFAGPGGEWTVIVKCDAAASFEISGLAAGRYAVSHATEAGSVDAPPVDVGAEGIARVAIPDEGVITLYRQ